MIPRKVLSAAARRTGLRTVFGHFDGLAGAHLSGWVRGARAGALATLMFGEKVVARSRTTMSRGDLTAIGIEGTGFLIPIARLTQTLEDMLQDDAEPRSLHVNDSAGVAIPPAGEPVSAAELQVLLAVGLAVNSLGAPVRDDDLVRR